MAHPLRLQMLSLLTGAELSAAEVARELDITQANASYHLRVLESAGLLAHAGEEKVRGGVAKKYRHPWDDDTPGRGRKHSAGDDHRAVVQAVAHELVRRSGSRAEGTTSNLTDAEVWVQPSVWDEVQTLAQQASRLLHAQAQPPRTPETVHVNMTAALFQMEQGSQHEGEQ